MEARKRMKRAARRALGRPIALEVAGAQQLVEFQGASFLAGTENKIEQKILSGVYDPANLRFARSVVSEGDTCLDVGANIGVYTVLLATWVGRSGAVHAFEPVDHVRAKLGRNVAMNGLRNTTVFAQGLGDADTTLEMNQVAEGEFREGTSTFTQNENVTAMGADRFRRVSVPVRRLDTHVDESGLRRIDFVKVDVEGFELNFLRGAVGTLRKLRPTLLMEHNQARIAHLGIDESDFAEVARSIGYDFFELRRQDDAVFLVPFRFDRALHSKNVVGFPAG